MNEEYEKIRAEVNKGQSVIMSMPEDGFKDLCGAVAEVLANFGYSVGVYLDIDTQTPYLLGLPQED